MESPKVWNPNIVFLTSVLLGFLPASMMYVANYRELDLKSEANRYLILSITLFAFFLLMGGPTLVMNIGYGAFMLNSQRSLYHQMEKRTNMGRGALLALLCLAISLLCYVAKLHYLGLF